MRAQSKTEHDLLSIVCGVSSHMLSFRSPIGQSTHDPHGKDFWDLEFPRVRSRHKDLLYGFTRL